MKNDMFKCKNHITFEIQNLCLTEKRKEITKFNPFFYVFGYKLVSKPWLTYGENNE